jgi:hypothetical protein
MIFINKITFFIKDNLFNICSIFKSFVVNKFIFLKKYYIEYYTINKINNTIDSDELSGSDESSESSEIAKLNVIPVSDEISDSNEIHDLNETIYSICSIDSVYSNLKIFTDYVIYL